jgi:magnesium transporter
VLSVFIPEPQGLLRRQAKVDDPLPQDAVWLDLYEPSLEEERKVEAFLGVDVPTREEMREIESSARLYEENAVLYMTATVVTKLDTDVPENTQITFILAGNRLVTNRYADPLPFRRYMSYAERHLAQCSSGPAILAGLLESIVERSADVLERVGSNLDSVSATVFARPRGRRQPQRDFRGVLEQVGRNGDLISKSRETLVSLGRLLVFAQQASSEQLSQDVRGRFRTLSRDVTQMSDHASFLGNKASFILDATLGLVSIDQNNILKIFSVVTVFLLPPSVIGAIYGMNFEHIPWLHEPWGFWYALGAMTLSAIVPWAIFKWRGWL